MLLYFAVAMGNMVTGRTSAGSVNGRAVSGMFEQDGRKCCGGIPYADERNRKGRWFAQRIGG